MTWFDEISVHLLRTCAAMAIHGALFVSAVVGCKGEQVEAPKSAAEVMDAAAQRVRPVDGITWPEPPADGSPVVGQFLGIVNDDGDARVQLRLFNLAEKPVDLIEMELRYLGAQGQELKRFPWKIKADVSAQSHGKYVVGAFLPAETSSAMAQVNTVVFADGTRWTAPRSGESATNSD